MKAEINLVTIWTDNIDGMRSFYNKILRFEIVNDLGEYVEFANEGVRFAICKRSVMYSYSDKYRDKAAGQGFELAFECSDISDLDDTYNSFLEKGVNCVQPPTDMPWGQRTALFSDPDGNIHEIFTELKE